MLSGIDLTTLGLLQSAFIYGRTQPSTATDAEPSARSAASLVSDGESIILDSGSTTTEVANHLHDKQGLKVTTNALNIALILGAEPTNSIHVTGGEFKAPTLSLSGEKAGAYFENIFAQKLFLAIGGISFEAGLTYPGLNDLYVKMAMIKSAARVYLVADSTKIGVTSFASLGGIDLIHTLITDAGISNQARAAFEAKGVEIIVAD